MDSKDTITGANLKFGLTLSGFHKLTFAPFVSFQLPKIANAITAFRAYQRTFLGPRPTGAGATADLVPRERAVVAVLLVAVVLAGVFPGPILSWSSRDAASGANLEAARSVSSRR